MTKFIAGMGFLVVGVVLLIPFNKVTGFIPSFSINTNASITPTKAQVAPNVDHALRPEGASLHGAAVKSALSR